MIVKKDFLNKDELSYVLSSYEDVIKKIVGDDIGISFFSMSEDYFDNYESLSGNLTYSPFDVTVFNDFSIGDKKVITDIGRARITKEGKTFTFLKVVTPFIREMSFDFLIIKREETEEVLKILKERKSKENFEFNEFPIIGLDFSDIKKNTIDFLLNEEFRKYCVSKHIKLKRGIILEGKPGTGKTLTIQWLKNKAIENKIEFYSFKSADDFMKNQDDYYDNQKKIFVFEDFDTLLRERKDTNSSPNQILGVILNTLEGVNEINNVVSVFTTNEVKLFDSAFIRPGRIDKVYTYETPKPIIYNEFFEAYIKEEKEFHNFIKEELEQSNSDISFAILKGICDDINIFKFSEEKLTKNKVSEIIKEKLSGANKQASLKNSSDYIL